MTRGGTLYQIHNDHLGRPELITEASKTIVWQSNNSPFGGMTATSNIGDFNIASRGSTTTPNRITGTTEDQRESGPLIRQDGSAQPLQICTGVHKAESML